jgi:hypothetical protein
MIDAPAAVLITLLLLSMSGIGVVVGLMLVNHNSRDERDRSD